MPKLYMLVGYPRSGKSTYAKQLRKSTGAVIVNPDTVRLALHGKKFEQLAEDRVWANVRLTVRALLMLDHDVIADATNLTRERRRSWFQATDLCPNVVTEYHVLQMAAEDCIARARAENDDNMVSVIERMQKSAEPVMDGPHRFKVIPHPDFSFEVQRA